jgi:hypothetical protein
MGKGKVVIQQAARKTTETPSPASPLALKGTGGESQTTYYGDRILEPSMNASINATAFPRHALAPNLSRWYARYMGTSSLALHDPASSCYFQLRTTY